jgi:hypothetical protein
MGDVFRVVFFLKAFLQQYSYATVLESHGQTVVWRQARPANEVGGRLITEVANLDYRHTILDRTSFYIKPIDTIVSAVLQDTAATLRLST